MKFVVGLVLLGLLCRPLWASNDDGADDDDEDHAEWLRKQQEIMKNAFEVLPEYAKQLPDFSKMARPATPKRKHPHQPHPHELGNNDLWSDYDPFNKSAVAAHEVAGMFISISEYMHATRESIQQLYPAVINDDAYSKLIRASHKFPLNGFSSGRYNFGYEIRFGKDSSVDYSVNVECPRCLITLLRMDDYMRPYVTKYEEWHRVLDFLQWWDALPQDLESNFAAIWLEMDVPEHAGSPAAARGTEDGHDDFHPSPSIFLIPQGLRRKTKFSRVRNNLHIQEMIMFNSTLDAVSQSTSHLISRPLSPALRSALTAIFLALPVNSMLFSFGIFVARREYELLRIEVSIVPNTADDIVAFLKAVDWPGDVEDIRPYLVEMVARTSLVLLGMDVGEDGVQLKVGVMGFCMNPEPSGRDPVTHPTPHTWQLLMDYYCDNPGLFAVTEAKCANARRMVDDHPMYTRHDTIAFDVAKVDWSGVEDFDVASAPSLARHNARVTHAKFVYTGRDAKPYEVKMYLELREDGLPRMSLNGRAFSNKSPRAQPPPELKRIF